MSEGKTRGDNVSSLVKQTDLLLPAKLPPDQLHHLRVHPPFPGPQPLPQPDV